MIFELLKRQMIIKLIKKVNIIHIQTQGISWASQRICMLNFVKKNSIFTDMSLISKVS